jgi:hypothetical protein
VKPCWSERLTQPVRDRLDDVTISARNDARHYMTALPEARARSGQRAAQLLLDGANAEAVTTAIELAMM